jgi:CRISPR-associated protein Cas2
MQLYLVCFDISDDGERTRVGNVLGEYGNRVQRSVFEVTFRSEDDRRQAAERLLALVLDPTSVRFYRVCENCRNASGDLTGNPIGQLLDTLIL